MPAGIDHLVIAVPDPNGAALELAEGLGVAFTAGGRHRGLGTFNRIAFLGDAYLELIGIENAAEAEGWPIGLAALRALATGGGLATYGLVDDQLAATVLRLQANGSSIGPVVAGSRRNADGSLAAAWWTALPADLGPDRPPFLIRHAAWGAEWGRAALAARRAFVQPAGSPAWLVGLEIPVENPTRLAAECAAELDMEFRAVGRVATSTVGRHRIRLVQRAAVRPPVVTLAIGTARQSTTALGLTFELMPVAALG
jgi:hypothetical protein